MRLIQQIAQLERKDTSIPQCALCEIFLSRFHIWLFLEFLDLADVFATFRDNVTILFAGIGRLNAHQGQICATLLCQLLKLLDSFIIGVIHIGVHRADNNGLVFGHAQLIVEIGCGQCDGRECITAAGLYADRSLFPQLILDGTCLRSAGRNGDFCICVYRSNLTVDTLYHRLILVIILEQLDKLLATHIIGKRPETLTRTTRK